eukprot:747870-Hanusia_phi.AAC.4
MVAQVSTSSQVAGQQLFQGLRGEIFRSLLKEVRLGLWVERSDRHGSFYALPAGSTGDAREVRNCEVGALVFELLCSIGSALLQNVRINRFTVGDQGVRPNFCPALV